MPTLRLFIDELYIPRVLTPASDDGQIRSYSVKMQNGMRQIHSDLPAPTSYWGYEGQFPGPTIDVPRDRQVVVMFENSLNPPSDPNDPRTQWPFAIAPDEPAGNPYFVPKVPLTIVHLHGSPNRPEYDGWADNSYPPGESATHHFPRQERAALYWYHDHANMITRLNVYAGLAGLYIVRDASVEAGLPSGKYEIPLLIQDRDLEVNAGGDEFTGRFAYQALTSNNTFARDFFLVNGTITPFKKVEQARYRLRILNGANSRFFRLAFRANNGPLTTKEWEVIGVDGGLLETTVKNPTTRTKNGDKEMVVIAPAERLDVIVDFSQFPPGASVELVNAKTNGSFSAPIMEFQVQETNAPPAQEIVKVGRSPRLASRYASTDEIISESTAANAHSHHGGHPKPIQRYIGLYLRDGMQTINGLMFHDTVSEKPEIGAEEVWSFINFTGDDHPMHLHLVNFEIIDRQPFKDESGDSDYDKKFHQIFHSWVNDPSPTKPPLPPGLVFDSPSATPPDLYEKEPKDTVRVPANTVTRIKTKFRLHTGMYMFHCHILEHEDMEMMRPMLVTPQGMPEMAHGGHEHT